MNVSSAASITAQQSSYYQQLQSDFQQLSQNLNSNNLKGAQTAYAAIQQLENSNSTGSTGSTGTSSNNPLSVIGQALQQGNLQAAKNAFQSLQKTQGGSHHHHKSSAGGSSSYGATNASNANSNSPAATELGTLNISA